MAPSSKKCPPYPQIRKREGIKMNKLPINRKPLLALLATLIMLVSSPFSYANPGIPEIPQIPAFLPMASSVPQTTQYPIDGEWMINQIGKRIRIERGRAYAVDPWVHLFVLKIQPLMVVIKDIKRTGKGKYVGEDLPLMGKFTGTMTSDGTMNVHVAGALGPVNLTFSPVRMDDQRKFDNERSAGGSYDDDDDYSDRDEDAEGDDYSEEDEYSDDAEDNYRGDDDEDDSDNDYGDDGYENDGNYDDDEAYYDDDEDYEEDTRPQQVKAKKHKLFTSCKGKRSYYSKVNGNKGCYTCPGGMKRASATRKMNHKKACVNREGKNTYAKGLFLGKVVKSCGKGKFKYKGQCYSCPKGYEPKFIFGKKVGVKIFKDNTCTLSNEEE
jgi:hypothetical protein